MRVDDLRILEVGDRSLFADTLPDNTTLLWTGARAICCAALQRRNFGPGSVWFLMRSLRRGDFDLIVCHAPLHNPLGLRWMLRLLGRDPLTFAGALFRSWGVQFLRVATPTPLIVMDTEDTSAIGRHNLFLFPRCRAWFKRELPPDHWKVFVGATGANTLTARFRRRRFFQECVDKLRPISLGIGEAKIQRIDDMTAKAKASSEQASLQTATAETPEEAAAAPRCVDVFFAGALSNSHARGLGYMQLRALQNAGYAIDIAEGGLPQDEYFARCARAWLVWSPEGYGWDCFRHYEAPLCGAVPLISRPTIYRHAPLRDGEHCLTYDVEGDDLQAVVKRALGDKPRLTAMAQAAREHVLRHHTHYRLCEYMASVGLDARRIAANERE